MHDGMLKNESERIKAFLEESRFGVVGASVSRAKYGNKGLRCYWQAGREAVPINPGTSEIEGANAYPNLGALPEPVGGLSIITPGEITTAIMREGLRFGIRHYWLQPGAESPEAVRLAEEAGVNIIYGGACLLVVLGYRERG